MKEAMVLRLNDAKHGKRIEGKLMLKGHVTHDEAQKLSNRGYASWFRLVPRNQHPCASERVIEKTPKSFEKEKVTEEKPKAKPSKKVHLKEQKTIANSEGSGE